MKIAYPSNATVPSRSANTIQVMKMCEAFARNGHEVTLFAPERPALEADVDDVYAFYDVDPCFELRKLSRPPLSSVGTFVVNARAGRAAARLEPDLAYGRSVVGCLAAARRGVPTVFEAHAPMVESRFGRVEDFLFRRLARRAAFRRLVVISEALSEYYRETYPDIEGDVVVARDGADPVDESRAPASLETGGDGLQVGYVGHLYRGRGLDVIAGLAGRCRGMDFHVVGGDPADVAAWRDRTRDRENLTFYGFVPPADVDAYRLAFDVQLAPYQRDLATNAGHNTVSWMSPLKLFEYMAAGRPIVASDLPAIREILTDGETALLCEPADRDAWARALERLAGDPALRTRLGRSARAAFEANYTWTERARRVLRGRAVAPAPRTQ